MTMLTKDELKMQRRKFSRNPNHDYRGDDLVSRRNYLLIIESHLECMDKYERLKKNFVKFFLKFISLKKE